MKNLEQLLLKKKYEKMKVGIRMTKTSDELNKEERKEQNKTTKL